MRVLPLQGCAGSDSSASGDELGHRSGFLSFRVVRPFFVRGGAESVESLWTILICAISRFRIRGLDCPHPYHPSACRRFIRERASLVLGSAESMESGGQSLFALRSGFAFGARIDHASHTPRCRRPVPVRRFPFRNSPAGLLINNFFFGLGRGNVDNPFRRFRPCLGPGLDCPHSHSPIRPRRSGRDPSSGLRRPGPA